MKLTMSALIYRVIDPTFKSNCIYGVSVTDLSQAENTGRLKTVDLCSLFNLNEWENQAQMSIVHTDIGLLCLSIFSDSFM